MKPRNNGKHGRPTYNQAQKVISRFGGESQLAYLLNCSRITIYRWQYRRPYGCDGLIPSSRIEQIKAVARTHGVLVRPEDWVPETLQWAENEPIAPSGPRKLVIV
jgi:hypothetical protein